MKRKRWVGIAAAAALCALGAAVLFVPDGRGAVEQARAAVAGAAEDGSCPVDFTALQAENEDIYAWLYIPGTGISEPLLQRADDSYYYLTHDSAGREDASGALFTESAYNRKDFSDPATVIYGKNTAEGRLFSPLQAAYSSPAGLEEYSEIIIYLPEKTVRYQVFAAAPFRNYHLLHYFDFSNEDRYLAFLQAVGSVRTIDANWNRAAGAVPGDPLLILSTTRSGSSAMSYLVLAKEIER